MALDTWILSWSTSVIVQHVFGSLQKNFVWKENFRRLFHAIYGQCVCSNHYLLQFTICFVLCKAEVCFWLTLVIANVIRFVVKVAPSVKFISSNHLSSMTTRISEKTILSLDVWSLYFFPINFLILLIIFLKYVTQSKPMFWDCSWSWHFLVVHNQYFCITKMVIQCHCLRINIHESIHAKLKLEFMMKPL